MSIKWKLSIAFILLSLGIVGLYIITAKRTFESDKISYIFDTQQRQVSQLSNDMGEKSNRMVFDARAILSGFSAATQALSPDAQSLLQNHPSILAIDLKNLAQEKPLASLERTPGSTQILTNVPIKPSEPGKIQLEALPDGKFIAAVTQETGTDKAVLRVYFELKDLFAGASDDQTFLLVSGDQVVINSNTSTFPKTALNEYLKSRPSKDIAATNIGRINGKDYLISTSPLKIGNFQLLVMMSQSSALAALNVLYQRSLVFLLMSFFATVIIALILSNSLTQNINDLKRVAEKIGDGDFSATPTFESKDEVGVLANAFRKMVQEIQKLLLATADKARMEAELKTAALVQESLFPVEAQYRAGDFKVGGVYVTSTECGGDWWYYFEKGDFLYVIVADATGHGTPAALITSAARSIFSYVQTKELELTEVATLCDEAIYQCSKGRVYMTAFLLKINTRTGLVNYINACHEPPYLWSGEEGSDERSGDYMVSPPDTMFGETKKNFHQQTLIMKPGEKLIVYTDGVTAVENLQGKSIPNRKILRIFEATVESQEETAVAAKNCVLALQEYTQGHPLPDDITLVVIERMKAEAVLATVTNISLPEASVA